MSSFVACGGTGAHVVLAMIRLHILGYPFGFFTRQNKGSKEAGKFPDLFLLDADDDERDKDGQRTAWGEVQRLVAEHPGIYRYEEVFGLKVLPRLAHVSPLPAAWDNNDHKDTLGFILEDSERFRLLTSEFQRGITPSEGFYASGSGGALVFSLTESDTHNTGNGRINNNDDYQKLLIECKESKVVVCGSIVGGTGASCAPTLALRLHEKSQEGAVMPVLIHEWFKLIPKDRDDKDEQNSCDERNQKMKENAASGLAFSGEELAKKLTTVLLGIPESQFSERIWGDNCRQPIQESYAHVVGALAGIQHLLSDDGEGTPGLYGVAASDRSKLTEDLRIGEGNHSTLKDLVGQAECLVHVLENYCKVLRQCESRQYTTIERWFNEITFGNPKPPQLKIYEWVYNAVEGKSGRLKIVIDDLETIKKRYRDLLGWLRRLLKYPEFEIDKGFFDLAKNILGRERDNSLPSLDGYDAFSGHINETETQGVEKEEYIALALFDWFAKWVKDWWEKEQPSSKLEKAQSGYWPTSDPNKPTGIIWGEEAPGELCKASKRDIALESLYKSENISVNGRPDPIALVNQFEFELRKSTPTAIRKLELLLVGRALGKLELKNVKIPNKDIRTRFSVENLFDDDLAQYRIVHKRTGKTYGFSSPQALLCPTQDVADEDWQDLWKDINRDQPSLPKASWLLSLVWSHRAQKARNSIAVWIKRLEGKMPDRFRKILARNILPEEGNDANFGIGEWLWLSDGKEKIQLPLPVLPRNSISPPGNILPDIRDERHDLSVEEIKEHVHEFEEIEGYSLIKDVQVPNRKHGLNMIWRKHLDELQKKGRIFAWWPDDQKDEVIYILRYFEEDDFENKEDVSVEKLKKRKLICIRNLRVINREAIQIETCIPLSQRPVPGSSVEPGTLIFPDLPLRPDYISLARQAPPDPDNPEEGEGLVESNWKGWKRSDGSTPYTFDEKKVTWDLHLAGRKKPLRIEKGYEGIKAEEAHWMIWPNFKSAIEDTESENDKEAQRELHQWKAYYIYEYATRKSLEAQAIILDGREGLEIRKRTLDSPIHSRALKFSVEQGRHTGGPPVALCAYDHETKEDVGIYAINLVKISRDPSSWKLAIDFGTSHTVAAIKADTGKGESVDLKPEYTKDRRKGEDRELSFHISESWPASEEEAVQMGIDLWRPTYYVREGKKTGSMLPSDLWFLENLKSVKEMRDQIKECMPMIHFAIPPMELCRSDSGEHIISGFKWAEMLDSDFKNYGDWLQEKYLGMVIEIFVADILRKKRTHLPSEIEFIFTYPLRRTKKEKEEYEKLVKRVLRRNSEDLGHIYRKVLFYSESHAAALDTGKGEYYGVKLVADLGGGTLDVLISAEDVPIEGKESRFRQDYADSVNIGVDVLLRKLANRDKKYLPDNSTWNGDELTRLRKLRAWMRQKGSPRLFSRDWVEEKTSKVNELGLKGFEQSQDGFPARKLIERYFQFIADFLARALVVYVRQDFWNNEEIDREKEFKMITLIVQLRGNGWYLWYNSDKYSIIQEKVMEWIKSRAHSLWNDDDLWVETDDKKMLEQLLARQDLWHEPRGRRDPKLGPIRSVVAKGMDDWKETDNYRSPLCKVQILRREDAVVDHKDWIAKLPFRIGDDMTLGMKMFDPPLHVGKSEFVQSLEDNLMREIRDRISKESDRDENGVDAPIAALVWEKTMDSPEEFSKD